MDINGNILTLTDTLTGNICRVTRSATLGRNETNECVIDAGYVSRVHCKITRHNNIFVIEDLKSLNGTFLNGIRITRVKKINPGDKLALGDPNHIILVGEEKIPDTVYGNGKNLSNKKAILLSILGIVSMLSVIFFVLYMTGNSYKNEASIPEQKINTTKSESIPPPESNHSLDKPPKESLDDLIRATLLEFGESEEYIDETSLKQIKLYIDNYSRSEVYKTRSANRELYKDMIIENLKRNNLHPEYSFVPFVESGYIKDAYNRVSGARGMWQFLSPTARQYGLTVNNRIDERNDPKKSTEAAVKYIEDMTAIFGYDSFMLITASFNCGDGTLRAALKEIDNVRVNRSFIYLSRKKLIPYETRDYVYKITALIIMDRYKVSKNML